MASKREAPDAQLFIGDSRGLPELLAAAPLANVIITSPPYFDLLDYGTKHQIGIGSKTYERFLTDVEQVLKGCFDRSTNDASLWIICDNFRNEGTLIDLPDDFKAAAKRAGWTLRECLVWNKVKTRPVSGPGVLRNNIEHILNFVKDPAQYKFRVHRENHIHGVNADYLWKWPERYSPLGLNLGKIWTAQLMNQGTWGANKANHTRIHFCPFPQSLVAKIINIASDPGDVILDPFAGSGTVPAQAALMGRKGIGVEINGDFRKFFADVQSLFQKSWKEGEDERHIAKEDRIREALLVSRMRGLKSVNLAIKGKEAHCRHIRAVGIIEPISARETIADVLSKATNSPTLKIPYEFHVITPKLGVKDRAELTEWFEEVMKSCSLAGMVYVEETAERWSTQKRLASPYWWAYDGGASLKPLGPADRNRESTLQVLANFSAPSFGSKSSPLELALLEVRQAYIRQVANDLNGDENEIANTLGTTRAEVHRFLHSGRNDLRKATRSKEHAASAIGQGDEVLTLEDIE